MTDEEQRKLFQQTLRLEIRYLLKEVMLLIKQEIKAQRFQKIALPQNNEEKVLMALRALFGERNQGFASLKEISRHTGLCHSTVVGNINRLILKGRLLKESDRALEGGNLKNFFHILDMD